MELLWVRGGIPLRGTIQISGAKNAVLVELASLLLTSGVSTLCNVPDLSDVQAMVNLLAYIGCLCSWNKEAKSITVDTTGVTLKAIPSGLLQAFRASILVLGPLLARFGRAIVAYPGGCPIGARPIDFHLKAFESMGAQITVADEELHLCAEHGLKAQTIVLEYPSVGATENVLLAAVRTPGKTIIYNAALEPEIFDLIALLQAMGADVTCDVPAQIIVHGSMSLHAVEHTVLPDRLEAGTYLAAAANTGGEVTVAGISPDLLRIFIYKLQEMGHQLCMSNNSISLVATSKPRAVSFTTMPYPGFPTDLQAPMTALLISAAGVSKVHESVFEKRLVHLVELQKVGARTEIAGDKVVIEGVDRSMLRGAELNAVDIRGAAGLVIAALGAEGESLISGIEHIRRGYVAFEDTLRSLGAEIAVREIV